MKTNTEKLKATFQYLPELWRVLTYGHVCVCVYVCKVGERDRKRGSREKVSKHTLVHSKEPSCTSCGLTQTPQCKGTVLRH